MQAEITKHGEDAVQRGLVDDSPGQDRLPVACSKSHIYYRAWAIVVSMVSGLCRRSCRVVLS